MTKPLSVVAVVGSLHAPSKTAALADAILDELVATLSVDLTIESHVIQISEIGPLLAGTLVRSELPPRVQDELRRIEEADLLVVATPVYRASFTGLFKHLFDFVDQYALIDTPVLLAASGGSERHSLILEHQLRPLFGFFQALTLPLGVYAHDSDFTAYRVTNPLLVDRIANAVRRGLPLVRASISERAQQSALGAAAVGGAR